MIFILKAIRLERSLLDLHVLFLQLLQVFGELLVPLLSQLELALHGVLPVNQLLELVHCQDERALLRICKHHLHRFESLHESFRTVRHLLTDLLRIRQLTHQLHVHGFQVLQLLLHALLLLFVVLAGDGECTVLEGLGEHFMDGLISVETLKAIVTEFAALEHAKVAEVGQAILDVVPHRAGHHQLPAFGQAGNTGSAIDHGPKVVHAESVGVGLAGRLAKVNAHAHTQALEEHIAVVVLFLGRVGVLQQRGVPVDLQEALLQIEAPLDRVVDLLE
mmetsp:Transcript_44465/g.112023  ORF Transcript_44465/g.112023 Transcript_44465/m.112023 type:complete len:276 (+) Transcript_44465:437-1264(+)